MGLTLLLSIAGPAFARLAPAHDLVGYVGRCGSLTLLGRLAAKDCVDELGTLTLADGRSGFVFFFGGRGLVAFTAEHAGMRGDDGVTGYAINQVNFLFRGEAEIIPATGRCQSQPLTDPDAEVTCEIQTAQGRFASEFHVRGGPGRLLYGMPDLRAPKPNK